MHYRDDSVPYRPRDFSRVLDRCLETAGDPLVEWLKHHCDESGKATFVGDLASEDVSFGALLAKIEELQREVVMRRDTIRSLLGLKSEEDATEPVANVSPREVRVWCQLNTIEIRQELAAARASSELLVRFMSKSVSISLQFFRANAI